MRPEKLGSCAPSIFMGSRYFGRWYFAGRCYRVVGILRLADLVAAGWSW